MLTRVRKGAVKVLLYVCVCVCGVVSCCCGGGEAKVVYTQMCLSSNMHTHTHTHRHIITSTVTAGWKGEKGGVYCTVLVYTPTIHTQSRDARAAFPGSGPG